MLARGRYNLSQQRVLLHKPFLLELERVVRFKVLDETNAGLGRLLCVHRGIVPPPEEPEVDLPAFTAFMEGLPPSIQRAEYERLKRLWVDHKAGKLKEGEGDS